LASISTPVAFDGLWLQKGETYGKSNTSAMSDDNQAYSSDTKTWPTPPIILQAGQIRGSCLK